MANQWLRLWHDMPTDPKWRTIAKASGQRIGDVMAVYCHLLVCASNATERGRTQSFCSEDVASALDIETEQVEQIIDAMQGRVLESDTLMGWEKRQAAREDGSAERAKAWREAKKQAKTPEANASERKQTQIERERTPDKDKTREDKDKKEVIGDAKRRKQLPADFYPDETGITAIEQTGLSLALELQKFSDHHKAKGSVMLDWQAAWRTWVSNAVKFAPRGAAIVPTEPAAWYDTRGGVSRKASALGIHPWNELEEQWPDYRARVMQAAKEKQPSSGFNLDQLAAMAEQHKRKAA